MELPVYLDNNSTTPLDPLVLEAMLPFFAKHFANPSNTTHSRGEYAAQAVERARKQVASLLGATPREVVFTSGATESNNLAILGAARRNRARGDHIITTAVEHKAVLAPCRALEREGFHVTVLDVDPTGRVDPSRVERAITPSTILLSVMAANNEMGTLQPLTELGEICRDRRVLFHTDAAQVTGKVPVDVDEFGVDLLSISAHKMYGPKGVGALYVRSRGLLQPLTFGGGQEGGLRPGTLPVPNIVGLGAASQLADEGIAVEPARLTSLGDRLRASLSAGIPDLAVHGHPTERLPGLFSVGFGGIDGDALIHSLRDVAVSQGASCSAGSFEPSHVLRAVGLSDELARATLRFGIGRFTTEEEVDFAAECVTRVVRSLVEVSAQLRGKKREDRQVPAPEGRRS